MADVVIPTIGRPSLWTLLRTLETSVGQQPGYITIVDDRSDAANDLTRDSMPHALRDRIRIVRSAGKGPAAARNVGWRSSSAAWIAFLDDDVEVESDWLALLHRDLANLAPNVAASQGRVRVPMPAGRAPTDWERNVGSLQNAQWITADMAYRRDVLVELNGFDERFRRAYREDSDLALRTVAAGYAIVSGSRRIVHPVRDADPWVSVRLQTGNADDALMNRLHGKAWRIRAGAGRGRFRLHALSVGFAASAFAFAAMRRPKIAGACALAWIATTCEFAWRRIAPGPKTRSEIRTMLLTSAAIPFAAAYHRARGFFA